MARMREALIIIRRLLDGEKLDFDGEYYRTETARLYSPPAHKIPLLVAAGGPKTARFAGEFADGLFTSVKDPAEAKEKVTGPFGRRRRPGPTGAIADHRSGLVGGPDQDQLMRYCPKAATLSPAA